jgi:hypothetical protein
MWPLAMEGGGAGPNSGAPAPESVGEREGVARGSPHIGLRVWSEWRHCRRWRAAAATGTSHCASCFGEFRRGKEEWAAWGARVVQGQGLWALLGCARALEGQVDHHGVPSGAARRARAGGGGHGERLLCRWGGPPVFASK